jgi:hypothetical protein
MARATGAGILDTLVLDDEDLGWLIIELAAGIDADFLTLLATVGTETLGRRQLIAARFAAQVSCRPTPTMRLALAASAGRALVRRRWLGRDSARRRLGQFREQERLVRIVRGQTPAFLQEGIESLLNLVKRAPILPPGHEQLDDHLLENADVVGKFGGIKDGRCWPSRRRVR